MVQFHGMLSEVMLALPQGNMPQHRLRFTMPLGSHYLQLFRVL